MKRVKLIIKPLMLLVLIATVAACENYDLEVQNKTDSIIDVYVDEFYEGAVAPKNYLLIRNLSHGEHFVEALDIDKNVLVEDSVYLDSDRKWVIHDSYYNFH